MAALAHSKQRYILMSQRKLRRVANEIRGKSVPEATQILRFMPYFAAKVILKHLLNAVANAEQKYGDKADPAKLHVTTIMVDEGPAYNRFKPRAQGRIYKIQSPTAHLMVEVGIKTKER
jgi:large subunit ribosomal protein L22